MEQKEELEKLLYAKMQGKLKDVAFLELNKEVLLKDSSRIPDNIPVPIKTKDLISGVKSGKYSEGIPFQNIVEAMIYTLGCDIQFKYNNVYIQILKEVDKKIDAYVLSRAIQLKDNKEYFDALIYFYALDKLSDNHEIISYNIANALKELAASAKERGNEGDYNLFHKLSYYEFEDLSRNFPDFPYSYYHLGFYYMEKEDYDNAVSTWKNALNLLGDCDLKNQIQQLIESTEDKKVFEGGKEDILTGFEVEGLRKLIPLVEKYGDWSEAKYYTALAYRKLGNYVKAELLLNELLDSGESFPEIYNELGLCYLNLGDNNKCIDNLEKAVSIKKDPGYLCNLGIAYYAAGDLSRAKKYIDDAYNLNSDDEVTKKCRDWIDKEMST